MKEDIYRIKYSKFIFKIKFLEKGNVQAFKGSGIRGNIGNGLLLNNCIYKKPINNCNLCDYKNYCVVNNFFNSELKKPIYFVNDNIATAYIIECDNYEEQVNEGDELDFSVTLFGDNIAFIFNLINAIITAGSKSGLYSIKYILHTVSAENGNILWKNNYLNKDNILIKTLEDYLNERKKNIDRVTGIQLLTPFRYKKQGKYSENITIDDILIALNRRLQIIAALNGIEIYDYLKDLHIAETRKKTTWIDIERYSNKQNTKMKLGGVMGVFDLIGDIEAYLDFLIMGEITHIGKNNSFGLGMYRMF